METATTATPSVPGTCAPVSRRLVVGTTATMVAVVLVSFLARLVGGGDQPWRIGLDLLAGLAACAVLPMLLRRPVPVAYAIIALAAFAPLATPAATLAVLVTAQRRPLRVAIEVAAAGVLAHAVQGLLTPNTGLSYVWWLVLVVAAHAALVAIGALVQARAALIASLRDRARRAEEEQGRRVAEARLLERARIARELHDVLAHRLSLVATYAGALEFRPDATEEQGRQAVAVIRATVQQALDELRQAIGVLRDDGDDDGNRPQPGVQDLPRLIEESRAAGGDVVVEGSLAGLDRLSSGAGRAAYRLVQEGLTNARRHAAGRPVTIMIGTEAADSVVIELRNPAEAGDVTELTGSGTGLLGLTERLRLVGGALDHGYVGSEFVLRAELPIELERVTTAR